MKLRNLYKKNIDRELNPAVSADDKKQKTIEESIFKS